MSRNTETKNTCYISDKIADNHKNSIRKSVCSKLDAEFYYQGNLYCILHYPNKDKGKQFNDEVRKKLETQDYLFMGVYFPSVIDKFPTEFKSNVDFRWATFSKKVKFNSNFQQHTNFEGTAFLEDADFSNAHFYKKAIFNNSYFQNQVNFDSTKFHSKTLFQSIIFNGEVNFSKTVFGNITKFHSSVFKEKVDLTSAIFKYVSFKLASFEKPTFFCSVKFLEDNVYFIETTFLDTADFRYSTIEKDINFRDALFTKEAIFRGVQFKGKVFFRSTVFKHKAYFSSCNFENDAYFGDSVFEENSIISFRATRFRGLMDLRYATIKGYIYFEGGEQTKHGKNSGIKTNSFEKGKVWLDLRESRHTKAERVSFHRVRLQPSWFLNTDAKDFVFTDVNWENLDNHSIKNSVAIELNWLVVRKVENAKQLFKIACRQLAENAENNNRFEEASIFRRMAFETEWLEKKEKIANWLKNLIPESEKLRRRFSGSRDEEDKPIPPTNSFGIIRRSGDFIIHFLYRITSFYGESWSWAFGFLLFLILLFFPIIYSMLEFQVTPNNIPLGVVVNGCKDVVEELKPICKIKNRNLYFFSEAVPHSLATAALQNVEYRIPRTTAGYIWTILEKIFAPLQAALLALAIRRKFMR